MLKFIFILKTKILVSIIHLFVVKLYFIMNDMIDGVINCPKSPTTEPRCHSDQVDPLVKLGISFLQNIINLPWPKNSWTKILIRAPVFGLWPKRARNGPKLENRTTPSVFELQFSNAQIVFTLPCPKNCWTKILIQGPVLGLWGPKNGQNFKIFVFGRRGFKFSEGIHICYMKSFMQ